MANLNLIRLTVKINPQPGQQEWACVLLSGLIRFRIAKSVFTFPFELSFLSFLVWGIQGRLAEVSFVHEGSWGKWPTTEWSGSPSVKEAFIHNDENVFIPDAVNGFPIAFILHASGLSSNPPSLDNVKHLWLSLERPVRVPDNPCLRIHYWGMRQGFSPLTDIRWHPSVTVGFCLSVLSP